MDTVLESFKRLPFSTILAARHYGMDNISPSPGASDGAKMCMAILRGDNREVTNFLNPGTSVNFQDAPDGWTPLIYSIYYGNRKARELLIARGADISMTDYAGRTVLMFAAIRGDAELAAELIRLGTDPNCRDNKGKSALDFAIEYHRDNCIGLLQPNNQ